MTEEVIIKNSFTVGFIGTMGVLAALFLIGLITYPIHKSIKKDFKDACRKTGRTQVECEYEEKKYT